MAVSVPDTAQCLHCGYALRGLPEAVCPECGQAFDPERPETYYDPTRRGAPKPLRPPSLIGVATLCALALVVLVGRAGPGTWLPLDKWDWGGAEWSWSTLSFWGKLFCCLPGILLVRREVRAWQYRRAGRDELLVEFDAARTPRRVMLAALVVFYFAILLPPLGPAARFYASWAALDAEADRYLVDPNTDVGPRRIGWMPVEYIWGRGQGFVWFQVGHTGGHRYGFVRVDAVDVWTAHARIWLAPGWYIASW